MDMRISGISNYIPISNILQLRYGHGKITIPVRQNQYLYSQLENVSGTPTSEHGIPLFKLKTLDVLLSRLKEVKKNDIETGPAGEKIDDTLDRLSAEYRKLMNNKPLSAYFTAQDFGTVLSVFV